MLGTLYSSVGHLLIVDYMTIVTVLFVASIASQLSVVSESIVHSLYVSLELNI